MTPEAEKRFQEWKKDLEERLVKFVFEANPKDDPNKIVITPVVPKDATPLYAQKWLGDGEQAKHGDKVFVMESIATPGAWCVFKNGHIVKRFTGDAAYGEASVYAAKLLQ